METLETYLDLIKGYESHSLNPWKRVIETLESSNLGTYPWCSCPLGIQHDGPDHGRYRAVYLPSGRMRPGLCPLYPLPLAMAPGGGCKGVSRCSRWGWGWGRGGLIQIGGASEKQC